MLIFLIFSLCTLGVIKNRTVDGRFGVMDIIYESCAGSKIVDGKD
jgi:hypothetical protein